MDCESRRYEKLESILQNGSSEPCNLPLEYLRNITNNFSDERLLGEGGFGKVYKGMLQNGETIAVKKLNSSMPGVKDRQFENEAYHLMRLRHPNVVLLVACCSETENTYVEYNGKYIFAEKSERLLCLEYMPKGSLRGYLSDEFSGLSWDIRYKIIEGICYGLHYLHEEWQLNAPIVHMDLKPANILLDNNMVPKIADFGLSRLFSEEKTWTCTTSRDGTLGYMAPEYINRGLITTKSDIFSLGVIIIEIVTGHRDYPDGTGISSQEFIELTCLQSASLKIEEMRVKSCDTGQWKSYRHLPENLKERIRRYEQYKWQEACAVDEEQHVMNLPKDIRRDIKRHLCLSLLIRVPMFENMDDQLLNGMCDRLKPILYIEGSCIIREGDPVTEILFIMRGNLMSMAINGRTGVFNSDILKGGDLCGEELLTWALDPTSSSPPSSTRTVKTISKVEAFALRVEDLRFVATQFRRLHSKQLQHLEQWRTWAACFIQTAWRTWRRKKIEDSLYEKEKRLQFAIVNKGSNSLSFGGALYASRFAGNMIRILRRNATRKTLLQERLSARLLKPSQPNLS
ncbi:unnamed protein product [Urochloa humidicola]